MEPMQDREQEGRRLPAPRHRAGEHVPALHRGGDRVLLDRGGTGEAELAQAANEVGMQAERCERHGITDGARIARETTMPEARLELAWGCPRRILSPLRMPFRHSGCSEKNSRIGECQQRSVDASRAG